MEAPKPSFQDYELALKRLQVKAHQRRAVITRGVTSSIEMPILDEQEIRDHRTCQLWQAQNGFYANRM